MKFTRESRTHLADGKAYCIVMGTSRFSAMADRRRHGSRKETVAVLRDVRRFHGPGVVDESRGTLFFFHYQRTDEYKAYQRHKKGGKREREMASKAESKAKLKKSMRSCECWGRL